MNVWRLITHHDNPADALAWYKANNRVCIGWDAVGNIHEKGYRSASEIGQVISKAYPDLKNAAMGGPSLWNFYREVRIGDLILLRHDNYNQAVVEVKGNYDWEEDHIDSDLPVDGYPHMRRVKFTDHNPNELWAKHGSAADGQNLRWTLARLSN